MDPGLGSPSFEEKKGDPRGEEVWVRCAWEVWGGCGWEPDSDGEDFLLVGSVGHGPEGTFLLGVKGDRKLPFWLAAPSR